MTKIIYIIKKTYNFFFYRIKYYRKLSVSNSSTIGSRSTFEGANKVYPHASFCGSMGYGSYISHHCEIAAQIGRFTSIAPHVRTNHGIHPYKEPYVSTSPMFYSTRKQCGTTFADRMMFDELYEIPEIGNDCWIGENVFICGGIKIGDGVVVLAGAVVTKDVPPYAIVGGVPAKVLKYRYDEDTIKFLLDLKWWNMDITWIKDNWRIFCDIEVLKQKFRTNIYRHGQQ